MDREDCVSTPLTAMVMVRRLVQGWLPLVTTIGRVSKLHHLQLGKVRWPTVSVLEEAARAVMRSEMTYDLSTALLVQGAQSEMFLTNLTVADCFEIGRQYFLKERFPEAKEWLQHALAGVQDTDLASSRQTVLYYLAAALCFSGEAGKSISILHGIFKKSPFSKPPKHLAEYYNIMCIRGCVCPDREIHRRLDRTYRQANSISVGFYRNNTALEEHSRLCRGEVQPDSRLACRYVHYQQPHLRFQPFKLEELQLDPPVLRFYDLVSDKESESLINRAKPSIAPATTGARVVSEYRTSHVAWLMPSDTEPLSRRLTEATRLDTRYAEPHQVSRYGLSGEYLPHHDYLQINWANDRIATLMIYLNDVDQGGHTIFTRWGLSVPPVRNSAVLWFNYKPSGEPDEESHHGGCPILKGTKWVLNKWFSNGGNHVNFPCSTDQPGSYKGFYYK